jgi:hypothetical protein
MLDLLRIPSDTAKLSFDYSDLEVWMSHADDVVRQTRRNLDQLAPGLRKG